MKAKVIEIQVGGGPIATTLAGACLLFSDHLDRPKLHFLIELPNGERKSLTIRDDDEGVVAYGDFEGLPNFLDYAKETLGSQ